ncbi:MAG TPA: ferric reductase-like transmembrane domain-containing protein [Anaerolineaceae bacterium]|nr:ferric reductase-like transmembrane domain-containing protein [Anaerolineaceae bacterium]HPN53984.1 ferric reductase-like transmembrane domain-containing protein [Anaerolineaceae bacterium]
MKRYIQGTFWLLLFLGLALAPIILLMIEPRAPSREFFREFSVALGFSGLALAGMQFVLTARFRFLSAPYGTDIIYHFHREISILSFLLILAHPIILFLFDPRTLKLLNFLSPDTPWRARAGLTALIAAILLVVLSVWRKKLKIEYNGWRIWHGVLATVLIGLAMVHIILVGYHFNTPFKQIFWVSYTLFWIGLLVYTRILRPFWLIRHPYLVEKVVDEGGRTYSLWLKPQGHGGLKFQPGQFAWIHIDQLPFYHRDHPFSISSSAAQPTQISFTIRELGDFTRTIKEIKPGTKVYLEGPFGIFSPDHHPQAKKFAYICGGVGITPAMSTLRTFADRGDKRPVTLIYANRDWENIPFRDELEALRSRINLKIVHVLEQPPEDWKGYSGYITADILNKELDSDRQPNVQEVFICGPGPMMDAVEKHLSALKFPAGDYHSERFDLA